LVCVPNILVVDDDRDILESLRDVLEVAIPDAHVQMAGSGAEALALMAKRRPDALITDYRMPGMDGLELVHAMPSRDHMAILIVTAFNQANLEAEAAEAGVCAVIPKPIVVPRFVEAVESCIASASA
jgi:CheY-like chemotaxis protein